MPRSTTPRVRLATVGAASSANKGAASMLQALIDGAEEHLGPCSIDVLTTYPATDRIEPPRATGSTEVAIVPATPVGLVLMAPLALLVWVLDRLRVPSGILLRTQAMRALRRADVVVDISGISFVDGRGIPTLVYNTLVTGIPLLLGAEVVKCSQALGPFERTLSRVVSRTVLGRCAAVCPRGERTERHLAELHLPATTRIVPAADLAFAMVVTEEDRTEADALLARHGLDGERFLGVMPSSVVERYCEKEGIDYVGLVASFIDETVRRSGTRVLLAPHSARPDDAPGRMNDRPVCRAVHAAVADRDRCVLLDESLRPGVLRALVERCDLLATSRFHAMISALATGTPVLVVGWSHKYAEVLAELGLERWVCDFTTLDAAALADAFAELGEQADEVRRSIAEGIAGVRERAGRNFDAVAGVLATRSSPAAPRSGIVRHDLSGVIEADMCIGCGACTFADPSVQLVLDPDKLMYVPDSPGGERAASVCPAVEVDFAELHERLFPDRPVTEYGVIDSVLLAQSVDVERNTAASSGGLVKELLAHLLDREDVDGAIALGHVDGLQFEARLLTRADQVDDLPGSIYHNLPQSPAIDLLRRHEGRYVVVGIPCQLEGLHKYIQTCEPHLAERLHTTIGLLCGWQYSHHSIRAICRYMGIDPAEIGDIAYRGGGPVGKLRITTRDGRVHSASRRVDFGYQVAFDRHFNTPRCHLCVDHSNYLAELVVGDAWLPSTVFTRTGVSLVVCRTEKARGLLDALVTSGRVEASEVTTEEIRESQTDRVVFGGFAYSYAAYLDDLGRHRPDMVAPGRDRAALVPRREVQRFHSELLRKLELQRAGRYGTLRWRKATLELPRLLGRYWRWFVVRILRVKSLRGEREEVAREKLAGFR
jgi:coenzyme F420-reducing hydrogenase beta subunit/polysaccharide pyruvyl transferase WcaK-like protein